MYPHVCVVLCVHMCTTCVPGSFKLFIIFQFYYFFLETFERLLLNALMKTLISIIIFLTTKIIAQQVPVSLASLYYISHSLFSDLILNFRFDFFA